jgi:hypothetical protein
VFCNASSSESQVEAVVKEILENSLPGSRLAERHGRFIRLDVSSLSSLGLGTTFRRLEALKENSVWKVDNYSISQCALEQVFIKLISKSTGEDALSAVVGDQIAESPVATTRDESLATSIALP